jgi:carboxyl-terminal processing protease
LKKNTLKKSIYIVLFLTVVLLSSRLSYYDRPVYLRNEKAVEIYGDAFTKITSNFNETVLPDESLYTSLNKMLSRLDPHSYFMLPHQFAKSMEGYEGYYYGVGINIEIIHGKIYVFSTIEDSPAFNAGILPGDQIVTVNGKSVSGLKNEELSNRLNTTRGEDNIIISIQRPGYERELTFSLKKEKISIKSIKFPLMIDQDIGYLKIVRFSRSTLSELENAISDLEDKGMRKLIIGFCPQVYR